MQKTEFALKFETLNNQNDGACPVIIVAAGSSSRMQGTDKQFSLLGGIPVLARTLCAFENSSVISEITVVTRAEKIADIEKAVNDRDGKDYKTLFQEIVQRDGKKAPEYEIVKEEGPDHAKTFTAVAILEGKIVGTGVGKTKKEAEKKAAQNALNKE